MTIRDRKQLKKTAVRRLQAASYPARKLILIYSGLMLGMSLLLAVCNYVITWQIDAHGGGLDGMKLRSMLETISVVLSAFYAIATPFWTMGMVYAALRLSRGKSAWPTVLLEGFRRRRPVFRFVLLQMLIYSIITIAAIYGAWILYTFFTPAGRAFAEAIMKLMTSGITDYMELIEQIPEQVMDRVARGYLPFFGVCALGLMLPTWYRIRLAQYLIMEREPLTPWQAIRTSGKIMRRKGFSMLLLDLSFWWYYLIPVILMVPSYADLIAQQLQLNLPVDSAVLYMGGNVLYAVLTLIFECCAAPRVVTTYALAYEALLEQYNLQRTAAEQEVSNGI